LELVKNESFFISEKEKLLIQLWVDGCLHKLPCAFLWRYNNDFL